MVDGHPIEDISLLAKPDAMLCLVAKAGEMSLRRW
jgi:hypothetical protein